MRRGSVAEEENVMPSKASAERQLPPLPNVFVEHDAADEVQRFLGPRRRAHSIGGFIPHALAVREFPQLKEQAPLTQEKVVQRATAHVFRRHSVDGSTRAASCTQAFQAADPLVHAQGCEASGTQIAKADTAIKLAESSQASYQSRKERISSRHTVGASGGSFGDDEAVAAEMLPVLLGREEEKQEGQPILGKPLGRAASCPLEAADQLLHANRREAFGTWPGEDHMAVKLAEISRASYASRQQRISSRHEQFASGGIFGDDEVEVTELLPVLLGREEEKQEGHSPRDGDRSSQGLGGAAGGGGNVHFQETPLGVEILQSEESIPTLLGHRTVDRKTIDCAATCLPKAPQEEALPVLLGQNGVEKRSEKTARSGHGATRDQRATQPVGLPPAQGRCGEDSCSVVAAAGRDEVAALAWAAAKCAREAFLRRKQHHDGRVLRKDPVVRLF